MLSGGRIRLPHVRHGYTSRYDVMCVFVGRRLNRKEVLSHPWEKMERSQRPVGFLSSGYLS